jgi:hypothetical protein
MEQEEILNIEYEIKKRLLKLGYTRGFTQHEIVKAFLVEYFTKLNYRSIPEYRLNFYYKSRKTERVRKGRIDIVIQNTENNIIYGIEIDKGVSSSSIAKLNQLNPKEKIIISLSRNIDRYLWKLPKDITLINIPLKKQYDLNDFHSSGNHGGGGGVIPKH